MLLRPIGAFPGEFAGASLKRAQREAQPGRVLAVPRRIRRGLIEACSPGGRACIPGRFPGEFAGASLKRLLVRVTTCSVWRVPRRIRRGLIEAGSGSAPGADSRGRFPGEFAGASLKLLVGWGGRAASQSAFPGEFAGASLKRAVFVGEALAVGPRSPANSPGPH